MQQTFCCTKCYKANTKNIFGQKELYCQLVTTEIRRQATLVVELLKRMQFQPVIEIWMV